MAPNILMKTMINGLVKLTIPYKKELFCVICVGVLSAVSTLLLPQCAQYFFRGNTFHVPQLSVVCGIVVLLVCIAFFSAVQEYLLRLIGENIVRDVRSVLCDHILHLPIADFDTCQTGDLLSRINNDTNHLKIAFQQGLTVVVSSSITVVGAMFSMLFLDAGLFALTILMFLMVFLLMAVSGHLVERTSLSNQKDQGALTAVIDRDISGIRTLRATNSESHEMQKILELINRVRHSGLIMAKIEAVISPIASACLQVVSLLIVGFGLWRVTVGQLSAGTLTQFILLLIVTVSPLSQIIYGGSQIGDSAAAMTRVNEILALRQEADDSSRNVKNVVSPRTEPIRSNTDQLKQAVTFEHVSFSYVAVQPEEAPPPSSSRNFSISDLSFSVQRGSMVAFVGPSGAGKSTVLQLIERFYEPNDGNILILDKQILEYNRTNLRSHITYIEQDSPILSGTLRENLLMGIDNRTDKDCIQALRDVNLSDLLEYDGLNLEIGERGVTLSGGERQRLALARALLSSSEIILLDEVTSNLDAANERLIIRLLNTLKREGRSLIIVAHRLATVCDADMIYVLDKGTLIGCGSHEELLENVPLYWTLAKEQRLL